MKKRLIGLLLVTMLTFTAFVGCGNTSKQEGNNDVKTEQGKATDQTEEIYNAVVKAYGENYLPSMKLDDEAIKNTLGLTKDMYEKCIAEKPMMSAQVDTFVAVKAAPGKTEEVSKKLTEYRETLVNDTMQYPMNQLKIQASKVVTEGDYVFFIMLGTADDTLEDDDAILKHFEAQNDIAVNAIKSVLNK